MNAGEGVAAALSATENSSEIVLPQSSREKLVNLIGLVATALTLAPEVRQELTEKLLDLTSERLRRFDQACRNIGHADERIAKLALEEFAETLLDWVIVRVVLHLWDRPGQAARRPRKGHVA